MLIWNCSLPYSMGYYSIVDIWNVHFVFRATIIWGEIVFVLKSGVIWRWLYIFTKPNIPFWWRHYGYHTIIKCNLSICASICTQCWHMLDFTLMWQCLVYSCPHKFLSPILLSVSTSQRKTGNVRIAHQ